jgi:hypothetical protein
MVTTGDLGVVQTLEPHLAMVAMVTPDGPRADVACWWAPSLAQLLVVGQGGLGINKDQALYKQNLSPSTC